MSEVKFTINGAEHRVSKVEADTSLNSYLRNHANLRGTKAMCHEGGCGACIVSVSAMHPVKKKPTIFTVNSCLVSILSCHGWAITTIEGIGNRKKGYHPIQSRLASFNGTQCGYCSPGWVMNMYSLHEKNKDNLSMKQVENSFAGNMCRCTGYRPILDAFKSFAKDAPPSLKEKIIDIEDVSDVKMCAKSGLICTQVCDEFSTIDGFCMIGKERNIHEIVQGTDLLTLESEEAKWYKVYFIKDIFDIFKKEGTDSYMLVAGNTAQGVYHMKKLPHIMIDINSVADLRKHEKKESLLLGANMTLNEIMDVFQDVGKNEESFKYTLQMYKHMDLVAHIPVRDIGTLAGNLSIKHQHNEFQSDMFVLLEAIGATLTIGININQITKEQEISIIAIVEFLAETPEKNKEVSLLDYLKMNMKGHVILRANLPPLYPDYVFHSYKIMPRAQNAHAHVNAAFLFKFSADKKKVEKASIVFGSIDPTFNHAIQTEKFLIGKNIFNSDVLKLAIQTLSEEIFPDVAPSEPEPLYRKKLAIGLFYKCILHISPKNTVNDKYKSGGEEFDRPVSSGKQEYDTNKDVWPLNKPINKLEGVVQCSGEAEFMNDLPTQPNEVYAAFVLSSVAHGTIDKIDGSEALAEKGVIAMYTAKDIPGSNSFTGSLFLFPESEEILCSGKIKFHGQPLAIVVAETERLAKLSAEKVKVTYKDTNNYIPILTCRDAIKSPSAKERIHKDKTNDAKKKGDEIRKVIKGTFDFHGQYHYTMEPQTCVCIPIEDGMDVYASSQWMDLTNIVVAQATKTPVNSVNVKIRRIGGAYGAKISRNAQVAGACAVAAKNLNRPVRFVMSIESNMSALGKRLPVSCDYEVGVNDSGKIQYLNCTYYQDDGCTHNENISIHTMDSFFNCYDNSTWFVEANSVLTDLPSNTWCRAPGTTEGIAMIENIMEHIATETGNDPLQVRMVNMTTENNPLPDMIKSIKQSSDYDKRVEDIKGFNALNRWRKRGISVLPIRYGLDYWGNFSAFVSIYQSDGTISICHAGIEMGQGINTKVAQVCAFTLGVPLNLVTVKPSNNLTIPNAIVTGGSIGSEVCCYAVKKACEILLERLEPIKKASANATWPELILKAYYAGIDLCAHYMHNPAVDKLQPYNIWAISVLEIEVDVITGNHQVLRVDLLEDTGESLSPEIDVGQVEGAFIMGLGYWSSEKLKYDKKTGALLTNRTWTYKPPGAKDVPIDFRIQFLRNAPNPAGVLRSKATGEPPLNLAFGFVCALRHAIASIRQDNGLPSNEWYNIEMPCSTENIVNATGTEIDDFKL